MIDQLDRSRRFALAENQTLLDQRVQMAHDAVGRLDLEAPPISRTVGP